MRLLLIEDDDEVARYVQRALGEAGHEVDRQATGPAGLETASLGHHDLLIVDRLLPGLDGLDLISTLRSRGLQTPVVIVSAVGDVDERIRGLRTGGDDYLVKPFDLGELIARIEVLGRRARLGATAGPSTRLCVADLELDLLARVGTRAGIDLELKPQEFKLLEYLMRNAGQVLTRAMILEAVWDYHFDPQTNVVDVHVSRLRSKINLDHQVPLIHTIRGSGYCLKAC